MEKQISLLRLYSCRIWSSPCKSVLLWKWSGWEILLKTVTNETKNVAVVINSRVDAMHYFCHESNFLFSGNMICKKLRNMVVGAEKYCRKTWDLLSSRAAAARWRGGDGCSFPAAHQLGRRRILNISGNCWDLFINVLRVIWIFTRYWGRRSDPHLWARLDRPHCKTKTLNLL